MPRLQISGNKMGKASVRSGRKGLLLRPVRRISECHEANFRGVFSKSRPTHNSVQTNEPK